MKVVVTALYNEPILFLGAVQAAVTALAADNVISGWIPVVTLGVVAAIQRNYTTPAGR